MAAPAASGNRHQGVGISRLDIPGRSIHESIAQSDFAPLAGAALAAHKLRERFGIAPHMAELVARLAGLGGRP